jgi:hypothetical protein
VSTVALDVNQWAQEQFGECELGDRRRTKRLVSYAAQAAASPDASTPRQTETWNDCRAAYRLFDQEDVTFAAITAPHHRATRARTEGTWLLISDTTDTHFPGRDVQGLGHTGDGGGRGFLLHSCLMVSPDGRDIAGLAGQTIRYRRGKQRRNSHASSVRREDRESIIWGHVIDQVGAPPEGVHFIHVFDRGGDQFELYCRMRQHRTSWVVRAARLNRHIVTPGGRRMKLDRYLKTLPVAGTYQVELPANKDQPARTATMEVRHGAATMPRPKQVSPWVKQSGVREVAMYVVEAREIDPPPGVQPAQWVLWTDESVETFSDACRVVEYYKKRPIIEDWHKALKTGCRLESRQYETAERLEAVTGLMSVLAVRLLQLKTVARHEPERPAEEVVPKPWIKMLYHLRKRPPRRPCTVRDFFRDMAKLGGFLGRKSDGEPGWITVWRGFEKLHLCLRGAQAYQ